MSSLNKNNVLSEALNWDGELLADIQAALKEKLREMDTNANGGVSSVSLSVNGNNQLVVEVTRADGTKRAASYDVSNMIGGGGSVVMGRIVDGMFYPATRIEGGNAYADTPLTNPDTGKLYIDMPHGDIYRYNPNLSDPWDRMSKITVDGTLSSTSTNPISNKAVTLALSNKLEAGDIANKADKLAGMLAPEQWPKVVVRNITASQIDTLLPGDVYFDSQFFLHTNGEPIPLGGPQEGTLYYCLADGKTYYRRNNSWHQAGGSGNGTVQSVSVNGGEPQLPNQDGNIDIESVDGITPHIDAVSGYWFIGNTNTGVPARGPQGNSGYTGAVGELEVVEDYTEGGVGKAASAEAVKEMAIKSIPDAGTFANAYEKARANNVVFPWFLRDVDENGNPIEKMIWHNGYRKFVDAIGAEVEGQRNGLTIKVNADCDLYLGWKNDISYNSVTVEVTIPLIQGINNFSFAEIHDKFVEELGSEPAAGTTYYLKLFDVRESGTTTSHGNYVEDIDFGGMTVKLIDYFMTNWDSLESIKRMDATAWVVYSNVLSGCDKLVNIQMTGSLHNARSIGLIGNCPKLERVDLKGYEVDFDLVGGFSGFNSCPLLEYVDIRDIDTEKATTISNVFSGDSSLKTLIIGNFDTSGLTAPMNTAFNGVTNCVLICTKNTPPVIKSGYDWLGNGLSNGACHFSAIYVPTDAVDAYKAANGWSEYADLIDDIAGTEYEDLI